MKDKHDPIRFMDWARQAALIGGASAIPGTAIGAFYGTLRTRTPILFALGSGLQCFLLGTTFTTMRLFVLHPTALLDAWALTRGHTPPPRSTLPPTASEKIRASTAAGALTGFTLGWFVRGSGRNVLPGVLMFSLFGWAGQHGYDYLDARNTRIVRQEEFVRAGGEVEVKEGLVERWAKSKWSPMSVLSDDEYERIMQEKVLQVEAEIAIIDEKIEGFRRKARREEGKGQVEREGSRT